MTDIKRKAPIKSAEVHAVINSTAYIAKFTNVTATDRVLVSDQVHTNQEEIIRQVHGAIGGFDGRGTPVNFEQAKNHYTRDTRLVDQHTFIVDAKI